MPINGQRQLRSLVIRADGPESHTRTTPVEPTFFQRYECKYMVSPLIVPELRSYLQPFCQPDSFAALRAAHRYPICSLYLDSHDLLLYRQTGSGEKTRFKLRVRTYSDDPAEPAYLEVKRKLDSVVHKSRVGLPKEQARALLRDGDTRVLAALTGRKRDDAEHFCHYVERTAAAPVIRVKYLREAYQATGNEPVRVTIDTELMHAATSEYDVGHASGPWTLTPVSGTILEIKFTERFPWWVEDLVRRFELHQQSVPKYVFSIDGALLRERLASLGAEVVDSLMRALEGSNRWFADPSFEATLLALLLSFVLGQAVAWVYAWSHSGLSYSRSFTQSLVLMTVVVSLVMFVIGNSIITAFGLLGALALIRFRNVLKDTRDTVFVFIALVVGMGVGAQRFMTAILGTGVLLLIVLYLSLTSFGTLGRYDGYLTCRLSTDRPDNLPADRRSDLARLLHRFCRAVKLISTRQTGGATEAEFVYQVGLRDRERGQELVGELRQLEGVQHASLVLRSELSEV